MPLTLITQSLNAHRGRLQLYFIRDGRYLCGRHYCETTYERCAGCDEASARRLRAQTQATARAHLQLILDRQYTHAEDASWHVAHFCCFSCDEPFIDTDYVAKNGQFFCLRCYDLKFARVSARGGEARRANICARLQTCSGCDAKIGATERFVKHGELAWHKRAACFRRVAAAPRAPPSPRV